MTSIRHRFTQVLTDAINDIKICEHSTLDHEHLHNVVGELISIVQDEISLIFTKDVD